MVASAAIWKWVDLAHRGMWHEYEVRVAYVIDGKCPVAAEQFLEAVSGKELVAASLGGLPALVVEKGLSIEDEEGARPKVERDAFQGCCAPVA